MTKVYLSYVPGLCLWFLTHSSPNPWNFLSNKSLFFMIFGLLSSVPEKLQSHKGEMYIVLSLTSPFPLQLGLC